LKPNGENQEEFESTRRRFLKYTALGAAGVALVAGGANALSPLRVAASAQGSETNGAKLSSTSESGEFFANAGTTFILVPVPNTSPQEFTHTVDGVVQVSPLGDCTVHFDLIVTATDSSTRPYLVSGTQIITTADGKSSVTSSVNGYLSSYPANATFLDIHYELMFTHGTGHLAHPRGRTDLHGFAAIATAPGKDDFPHSKGILPQNADLIAPPSGDLTGKACWVMKGRLELPGNTSN
jgi:hypothetical protein